MTYRNRISQAALAAVTLGALSVSAYAESPLPPHAWAAHADANQSAQATQSVVSESSERIASDVQSPVPPHAWAARADENRSTRVVQGVEPGSRGNGDSTTVVRPTPEFEAPPWA